MVRATGVDESNNGTGFLPIPDGAEEISGLGLIELRAEDIPADLTTQTFMYGSGVDFRSLVKKEDKIYEEDKATEIYNKISNKVKERKNKIQEQLNRNQILGINEFDIEFISENISDTIRALVVDLNKALARPFAKRNHFDLVNLKNRFTT
jgi:hypothetical protein